MFWFIKGVSVGIRINIVIMKDMICVMVVF